MKNDQLPEKGQEIVKRLRRNYRVGFEPYKVRDISLDLLKVTDLEHLLGDKDPFADVSSFPFWIKLWEAAMVLSEVMAVMEPDREKRVLELGAGIGVPGLVAAARGFQVTLSDYEPHILDFQRVSAMANNLDNVDFKIINWKKPPDLPAFDIILGAEILFRDEFFEPLLKVFNHYLKPGGEIYMAHDSRRQSLPRFLNLAQKDYEIGTRSRQMTSEDGELTILLNRLRRRSTNTS